MTNQDYMDFARTYGYDLRFTGLGMAYIVLDDLLLTEAMDIAKAEKELALIGMAVLADAVRAMDWEE